MDSISLSLSLSLDISLISEATIISWSHYDSLIQLAQKKDASTEIHKRMDEWMNEWMNAWIKSRILNKPLKFTLSTKSGAHKFRKQSRQGD
jgi:hypothetical protein